MIELKVAATGVTDPREWKRLMLDATARGPTPIEICGIERPAGTMLACTFLTANRDPEVWRDPDAFMSRRFDEPEAPRLLSFGGGPHYCLGATLARTTPEESVRGVAEIAPQLSAEPDSLEWSQVLGRSPARLPVTI